MLPEYLYNELPAQKLEKFLAHAAVCPACRRLRKEMETTLSRLAAGPGPVFLPGEKALLRERVKKTVRVNASVPRALPNRVGMKILIRPLLLPVALAAAVLLLVLFRTPIDSSETSSEAAALAALSEEVEEEFQLFADVWSEIKAIESLFSSEPETSSGVERSGKDKSGWA